MDASHPALPVILEIWQGERNLGTALACDFREDLQQAGKGRGYCAFVFTPPFRLKPEDHGRLSIRRWQDGVQVPRLSAPMAEPPAPRASVAHAARPLRSSSAKTSAATGRLK